jgi:FtsP/CotA-like multicopper oxidase with cupredoxin domain
VTTEKPDSRRQFLRRSAAALAALLVLPGAKAQAADALPKLAEDDPTAKGLKYAHDASKVPADTRKDSSQFCNNCRYFKGEANAASAPCDLFPGKAVDGKGWCTVWSKKG